MIFAVAAVALAACHRSTATETLMTGYVAEKIGNEKVKVTPIESELVDSITSTEVLDYRIGRFTESAEWNLSQYKSHAESEFLKADTVEDAARLAEDMAAIDWLVEAKKRPDKDDAVSRCYRLKYKVSAPDLETTLERYFWVDADETSVILVQDTPDRLGNSIGHARGYLEMLDSISK